MMNWIKKYSWLLLVIGFIFIIPIFIINVVDNESLLSFWGSYFGAVISAGVAFFILYIQCDYNKEQNEKNRNENEKQNHANRNLQLNILKYQQEILWLKDLKIKSAEYYSGFDKNDIYNVGNLILSEDNKIYKNEIKRLFKNLCDKKNNSEFVFKLQFPLKDMLDEREKQILSNIEEYNSIYKIILYDLSWLYKIIDENIETGTEGCYYDKHNNECKEKYGKDSFAVGFLKQNKPNIFDIAKSELFYKRVVRYCLKKISLLNEVQNKLIELINYEQEKIEKIIGI